jgi:hypothetical protein
VCRCHSRGPTKRKNAHPSPSNSSSEGVDAFIVSPCTCRLMKQTDKAPHGSGVGSSSQHAMQQEEEESSDAIQKVTHPLKPNYMYTFRRVDHRHPHRPTNFTRKDNHSMIQRNEDLYVWAPDLHDHHFWNNFQADWYIKVIKDRKLPITRHIYVDWTTMLEKRNPIFNKVIAKAQSLGIYDMLGMWQN